MRPDLSRYQRQAGPYDTEFARTSDTDKDTLLAAERGYVELPLWAVFMIIGCVATVLAMIIPL